LAAWDAALTVLPPTHPRRIGRALLALGVMVLIPATACSIALMNLGLGLALGGALLARAPLGRVPGLWWGAALAAWGALSMVSVIALGRHAHPYNGFGLLYTWLAFPVAWLACREAGTRRVVAWGLVATLAAAVALSLVQYTVGLREDLRPFRVGGGPSALRFTFANGFFSTHLTLAAVMMALLIALAGRLRHDLPRWAGWAAVVLAATGLVLSSGRLAFVGLLAALAVWGVLGDRRRALAALVGGGALLAVAITVLALTQGPRLKAMLRGEDGRWMIWQTTAHLIAETPLVGSGGSRAFTERYAVLNPQLHDGRTGEFPMGAPHAHNSLLSISAEHGVPAAILYLLLLSALVLAAWRRRDQDADAWRLATALVAGMLAAGMFEHLAGDGESALVLFALLGALTAPRREETPA
jgi:O-antigen ligase